VDGLRVILVSGTVGVGKTSALIAIGDALAADDEPNAIFDLDGWHGYDRIPTVARPCDLSWSRTSGASRSNRVIA
jgi:hypothetical protein